MMNYIAKIPKGKEKNQRHTLMLRTFRGIIGEEGGDTFINGVVEGGKLRTHKPLVDATPDYFPENVVAISSLNRYIALTVKEGSRYGCYLFDGESVTRMGASALLYTDPSRFCLKPIFTMDSFSDAASGQPTGKLLYFPEGSYNIFGTTGGSIASFLPSDFPILDVAAVIGGRLYGAYGQTVYVSGKEGCFDWTYDSPESESIDPNRAWKGNVASATEIQLPVTAIVGYKGSVLVFRENAIQKIVGEGNPYTVKDLFSVGAVDAGSISIADGKLYFISREGPMCYDGSKVKKLPAFPDKVVCGRIGCTLDGRYCFCVKYKNKNYIYNYDPESDSYGVSYVPGQIHSFASLNGQVYALINGSLYGFSNDRTDVDFGYSYPILKEELSPIRIRSLTVRAKNMSVGALECYLLTADDQGNNSRFCLAQLEEMGGEMTLRLKNKLPAVSIVRLELSGKGDVVLECCEVQYDTVKLRKV